MYIQSPYIFVRKNDKKLQCLLHSVVHPDTLELHALYNLCKSSWKYEWLISKFEKKFVDDAIAKNIILKEDEIWEQSKIHTFEIEINTHCNHRCFFCPVYYAPQQKKNMSLKLYSDIIGKIVRYPESRVITFNFYNEPTLDIYFRQRLIILKGTSLKVRLNTNGSGLNEDKLQLILNSGIVETVNINLPTLNPDQFFKITGSKCFDSTIRNIDRCIRSGIKVNLLINGKMNALKSQKQKLAIEKRYGRYSNVTIYNEITHNRAGHVPSLISTKTNVFNCENFLHYMVICVDGTIPLCSMDYNKDIILGNITHYDEINSLLRSTEYVKRRKEIYNRHKADSPILCTNCFFTYLSHFQYKNKLLDKD